MAQNKMLAMILAGGRGTRLEGLTKKSRQTSGRIWRKVPHY